MFGCNTLFVEELANDVEKAFVDALRFWLILFIVVISYNVFLLPDFVIFINHSKKLLSILNIIG